MYPIKIKQKKGKSFFGQKLSSITAAQLLKLNLRGKALGIQNKKEISKIKDQSDAKAKKIYEDLIKKEKNIVIFRASEGFGRDEVAESFKASDIIINNSLKSQLSEIKLAISEKKNIFKAKNNQSYKILNAITDVIENTNSFANNLDDQELEEIKKSEAGASSIISTGKLIEEIGNCPDYYADFIFSKIPRAKIKEFKKNPIDPEKSARNANYCLTILKRISEANKISINDLEIILMDRERETLRLEKLKSIQKKYPDLKITLIKDGTVAHAIAANLGLSNIKKHKIIMTVGAAPEGFFNLSFASAFSQKGAIASLRIYSKNIGKEKNLDKRYSFSKDEIKRIKELRKDDALEILAGKKLFTQNSFKGDVDGAYSLITHSGVFSLEGVKKIDKNKYLVNLINFQKKENESFFWIEKKKIDFSKK